MITDDLNGLRALLQCVRLIQEGHDLGLISGDQRTTYESAIKAKVQAEIVRLGSI